MFLQYKDNWKKTLKFANFVVNKKEFHASKKFKAIVLNFVNTDNISGKSKLNEKSSKCSLGYTDDNITMILLWYWKKYLFSNWRW